MRYFTLVPTLSLSLSVCFARMERRFRPATAKGPPAAHSDVGQCDDSLGLNLIIRQLWVTKSCLLSGDGEHGFLSATRIRSVSFCQVATLPLLRGSVLKPSGPSMLYEVSSTSSSPDDVCCSLHP